jgi:hypothetical protein
VEVQGIDTSGNHNLPNLSPFVECNPTQTKIHPSSPHLLLLPYTSPQVFLPPASVPSSPITPTTLILLLISPLLFSAFASRLASLLKEEKR